MLSRSVDGSKEPDSSCLLTMNLLELGELFRSVVCKIHVDLAHSVVLTALAVCGTNRTPKCGR